MNLRDLIADTVRTLWAHKLRTFLTMFGIAWGIISITLMVAATEGLRVGLKRNNESFGKDVMIFFAGRTSTQAGGMRSGRAIRFGDADYLPVSEQSPSCRYVMPELATTSRCAADTTPAISMWWARYRHSPSCDRLASRKAASTVMTTTTKPSASLSSAAIRKPSCSPDATPSVKPSGSLIFPTPSSG
jgi:ABC-type antimicrobial peptide transport system permease subunit